jgi:hypothetical protein
LRKTVAQSRWVGVVTESKLSGDRGGRNSVLGVQNSVGYGVVGGGGGGGVRRFRSSSSLRSPSNSRDTHEREQRQGSGADQGEGDGRGGEDATAGTMAHTAIVCTDVNRVLQELLADSAKQI